MLLLASTAHLGYECMDGCTNGHAIGTVLRPPVVNLYVMYCG